VLSPGESRGQVSPTVNRGSHPRPRCSLLAAHRGASAAANSCAAAAADGGASIAAAGAVCGAQPEHAQEEGQQEVTQAPPQGRPLEEEGAFVGERSGPDGAAANGSAGADGTAAARAAVARGAARSGALVPRCDQERAQPRGCALSIRPESIRAGPVRAGTGRPAA